MGVRPRASCSYLRAAFSGQDTHEDTIQQAAAELGVFGCRADGRTYADWTANFDVRGDPAPMVKWVRVDIFATCLDKLERMVWALGK